MQDAVNMLWVALQTARNLVVATGSISKRPCCTVQQAEGQAQPVAARIEGAAVVLAEGRAVLRRAGRLH